MRAAYAFNRAHAVVGLPLTKMLDAIRAPVLAALAMVAILFPLETFVVQVIVAVVDPTPVAATAEIVGAAVSATVEKPVAWVDVAAGAVTGRTDSKTPANCARSCSL